jgi:hypothetical protein
MAANARSAEVTAIGQLLTDYNDLEVGLLHCVQQGIVYFDLAFKTMFAKRGETARVNRAQKIGRPTFQALGLAADFDLPAATPKPRNTTPSKQSSIETKRFDDFSRPLVLTTACGRA